MLMRINVIKVENYDFQLIIYMYFFFRYAYEMHKIN
jgi:hypothetical protein